MKNLVILGASRSGKTTLAIEISKMYPNYHIINGDSISSAFQEALPQNNINKFGGEGMKEDFAKFCSSYYKNEIERNKGCFNYIFDSCDISVENAIKYFAGPESIILFLGYSELSIQEALKNYRKYAKNDWTKERTDDELLRHAKTWINKSKEFKRLCEVNNIMYIDTSFNRTEIINDLKEELKEKIKHD